MATAPDILCIGAVMWDILGRAHGTIRLGDDVPGRIERQLGGVALNLAVALRRFGFAPALLSAVGGDDEGEAILRDCRQIGIDVAYVHRDPARPTDRYLAIESADGLVAAIADVRTLEAAGAQVLAPLADGRLGSAEAPWNGAVALDGNLPEALMAEIAVSPLFAAADLRVASAAPAKARRLAPFLSHPRATLYLNLEEARRLGQSDFSAAPEAAAALHAKAAARILVTDGARAAALAEGKELHAAAPRAVRAARVTGAGDTLMAAHIDAERRGLVGAETLGSALAAATGFVGCSDD